MQNIIVPVQYTNMIISDNAEQAFMNLLDSSKDIIYGRYGSYHEWYRSYFMKRYNSGLIGLGNLIAWQLDYEIEKWFIENNVEYDLISNHIRSSIQMSDEDRNKYTRLILGNAIVNSPATNKALKDMENKLYVDQYSNNPFCGRTLDKSIEVMFKLSFY